MLKKSDFFKLGEIRKTHGVKGEMLLASEHMMDVEAIDDYLFFNLEECLVPFALESYRDTSDKTLLVSCKSIDSIEKAEQYVGTEVYLPLSQKSHFDELDHPSSLIGYELIEEETAQSLGRITRFIESHYNPLLQIERASGEEFLLPFQEAFILGIEAQKVYVKIPHGLLELED